MPPSAHASSHTPKSSPEPGPAPVLAAEQRQMFQRVLRALSRGGVGYAVAGAFAFQHYTGIWRATKDLDLFLAAENIPRALALCRAAGLVTEVTDPVWLAKAWAGDYYVDLISGMSNGVYWVAPEWIERAPVAEILGERTRVLGPEDIILSKLFVTRRERFDGSDICHMFYRCGAALDWGRLLGAVGEHWEMLLWHLQLFRYVYPSAAALVPTALWDELLARLRAPARETRFRGSLVDPLMFAPDVALWGLDNIEDASRRRRLHDLQAWQQRHDRQDRRDRQERTG